MFRSILLVCATLWALPVRLSAATATHDVQVLVAPPQSDLMALLKERFARRPWSANVQPRQRFDRGALATNQQDSQRLTVHIDLQTRGWVRLIFVQPGGQRFTIRDLPLTRKLDEVALETIALVVDSAADSLLAGLDFELSRVDAEALLSRAPEPLPEAAPPAKPPTKPSPPPPRPQKKATMLADAIEARAAMPNESALRLQPFAALGYVAAAQGSSGLPWLSGPSLTLGLRTKRLWLQSDATWFAPASLDAPPFRGQLKSGGIRAAVGWHRSQAAWSFAAMPLRLGLDAAWLTPQADDDAEAAPASTYFTPTAGGAVALHRRVGSMVVALAVSVDVDLRGTRFTGNDGGVERELVTLWRLRPAISLAVGWSQSN